MFHTEGQLTTSTFDANGNRLSIRDPAGVGQDCVYDACPPYQNSPAPDRLIG